MQTAASAAGSARSSTRRAAPRADAAPYADAARCTDAPYADDAPAGERELARVRRVLSLNGEASPAELSDAVSAYVRAARAASHPCDSVIARLKDELAAQELTGGDGRWRRTLLTAVVTWCLEDHCADS